LIKSKLRHEPQHRQGDLANQRGKAKDMIVKVEWKEIDKMKRPKIIGRFTSPV